MPNDAPNPPSLVDRLAHTRPAIGPGSRAAGLGVALLLALAPVLTIAGARLLEERAVVRAAALQSQAAAGGAANAGREGLRAALGRPALATTLDTIARALPADATLRGVARDAAGTLTLEVETLDPDRLRAALRRDAATARLRDAGQQRGDGGMVVTLIEAAR